MLLLLIDQDLDHDILRGLIRRIPHLNAVTALEVGMSEASDRELLVWAALEGRVTVTHDRRTMPGHAANLISEGKTIAGVFIGPSRCLSTKRSKNWTFWSPAARITSG